MEEILKQLLEGQKQLFAEVRQINTRLDKLEEKVNGLEVTLKENVTVTKGIQHWTEELNAQIHGLGHTLARVEGKVNQLEEKVDGMDLQLEVTEQQQGIIKGDLAFLVKKAVENDEAMYRLQKARVKAR